jgi:hypothetical protein
MKTNVLCVLFSLVCFGWTHADYTGIVSQIDTSSGCVKVAMDGNFPNQKMILYVPPNAAAAVGELPPIGAKVTALGREVMYEEHLEIIVHAKRQWSWAGK